MYTQPYFIACNTQIQEHALQLAISVKCSNSHPSGIFQYNGNHQNHIGPGRLCQHNFKYYRTFEKLTHI